MLKLDKEMCEAFSEAMTAVKYAVTNGIPVEISKKPHCEGEILIITWAYGRVYLWYNFDYLLEYDAVRNEIIVAPLTDFAKGGHLSYWNDESGSAGRRVALESYFGFPTLTPQLRFNYILEI